MRTVECPSCGRSNGHEQAFCSHCGGALRDGMDATSGREREHAVERRLAEIEIAKGSRMIAGLRLQLAALALGGIALAIAFGLERQGDRLILMGGLALATMLGLGAVRVAREPLLWTVMLAATATAFVVALLAQGGRDDLALALLGLALTWATVPQAARLQRILRDHPDLDLSRPSFADAPEKLRGRLERRALTERREAILMIKLVVVVVLAAVAVGYVFVTPPGLERARAAFEEAWNESGQDDLMRLFGPDGSDRYERSLARQLARRGWTERRPPLPGLESDEIDGHRGRLRYRMAGGELVVTFRLDERRGWELAAADLPDFEPPAAVEPRLADFERAWASGDVATLGAFWISEEKRELMSRRFAKEFEERSWLPRPPPLLNRRLGAETALQKEVQHDLGGGVLRTKWEYRHPDWLLRGLAFPR